MSENVDLESVHYNKLKLYSTIDIQTAISKALSELVGVEIKCHISNINFEKNVTLTTGATMELHVIAPRKSNLK